jgi:NAD+ synthase
MDRIAQISGFIKEKMDEMDRSGVVLALSGGLDSSVVTGLCVKAVGKGRVTAIVMCEKEASEEASKNAETISELFGIRLVKIDISKVLQDIGGYDFFVSKLPTKKLKSLLINFYIRDLVRREKSFSFYLKGSRNKTISSATANAMIKHRLRMILLYYYAEKNNLLVVGAANKTEVFTGLFSKFGVDSCADIMPIAHLFRTEVIEIAKELKLPAEVINKQSTPGLLLGIDDKYEDIVGINYEKVDLILKNLDKSPEEISEQFGIDIKKVNFVIDMYKSSAHKRHPNMMVE